MSNVKKLLLLAAVLLIAGLTGMILTYSSAYEKTSIQKEVEVNEAFADMDVQTDDAKLEILPTDEETATVVLKGKKYKKEENNHFSVDVENDTLSVKQSNLKQQMINFDFFQPWISMKIYIPKKQYAELLVSNDNGKIDVRDIKADQIDVQTGNGIINLDQVSGDTVKADTDNGKLKFDQVDGTIIGNTGNGIISLRTTDLDQDINLKSGNGIIDVKTENEPTNTTFVTDTGNGTVNILDKYKGDAVIGDGDHTVELSTGNGRIKVTKGK